MTDQLKTAILEGAKTAFFEAMMDGWVGEGNRRSTKTEDDDGYVTITYETEDGRYKVVDRYCTTPLSDKSGGTTTIFRRTGLTWSAVWWMTYGGHYPEDVIPFLKETLKANYEKGIFCGGRGPCLHPGYNLLYTNMCAGDFKRFQGTEEIASMDPQNTLGHHQFFGMSLL